MTVMSHQAPTGAATVPALEYAVGVVRVSERGKRDDEHFKSPDEQKGKIQDALRPMQIELAGVRNEIDVKGRWALKRRKGLTWAIEQIEAGYAKVLVVAYFDRLCRSIAIKSEVVNRVEAAGGRVLALDFGEVTEKTAVQWFSSTMVAAVAEYLSRSVGERLAGTQVMSIAAGIPMGCPPPGYRQNPETRRLVVHAAEAEVMRQAFMLRASGVSWRHVRNFMAEHAIVRTVGSVRKLLHSRTYLGMVFHGSKVNPAAHQPIIDRETFDLVAANKQETYCMPGRKSPLLMSTTRVLRCGSCGNAMASGTQVQGGKRYPIYRCNPNGMCTRRVMIDARIADQAVERYLCAKLEGESVTEGPGMDLIAAQVDAEKAQAAYARAQRNLADEEDEIEAKAILAEKRAARDAARERASELERRARSIGNAVVINAAKNFRDLSLDGQRELVVALLARVEVAPGGRHFRGEGRLRFVDSSGEPLA